MNLLARLNSKSTRIIFCVVLSCAAVMAVKINVNAESYSDIGKCPDYARTAISDLSEKNILNGTGNGKFSPGSPTTKAQMITVLVKALNLDMSTLPGTPVFKDVPKWHWAYYYVQAAYHAGLINGKGNGLLGADDLCTREEMVKMLVNALKLPEQRIEEEGGGFTGLTRFKDRGKIADWAVNEAAFAVKKSLLRGTAPDVFSPALTATREQMAVVIDRYLKSGLVASEGSAFTTYLQLSLSNQNGNSQLVFSALKPIQAASVESITDKNGKKLKYGSPFFFKDYFVTYTNLLDTSNCLREKLYLYKDENPQKNEISELAKGETYTVRYAYRVKGENTEIVHSQADVVVPLTDNYVESAMPINASQLRVRFNKDVEPASAADLSNYSITDGNGNRIEIKDVAVSADSRFVVVNLLHPIIKPQNIRVSIKNILTMSSEKQLISPFSESIPVNDTDKPVIEGLSTTNDGRNFTSVTLTFSEPVYSGNILVNNIPVGKATGEIVTIPGLSYDGTQSLQVDVLDLSDGMNVEKAAGTGCQRLFAPIPKETIPPAITGVSYDRDSSGRVKDIILTLSEALKPDSGYPASQITAFDEDNNKVDTPLIVTDSAGNPVKTDARVLCYTSGMVKEGSKSVVFSFAEGLNLRSGKYTFYFPKDLVYDTEGNGNDAFTRVIDFDAVPGA